MMKRRLLKMYGSTPTGNMRSYSYYVTSRPLNGAQPHLQCDLLEAQIPALLQDLHISPEYLPGIRALYAEQISRFKGPNMKERLAELRERVERLHTEEAALARLYAQGKLSDSNYDILHAEWQSKVFETHREITQMESGVEEVIDDLDQALCLLACIPQLFTRMDRRQQARLLQILVKRIIIDTQGTIISVELNPPFAYLSSLQPAPDKRKRSRNKPESSRQLLSALPRDIFHKELPTDEVGQFASMVSFPQRGQFEGLMRQSGENIWLKSVVLEE